MNEKFAGIIAFLAGIIFICGITQNAAADDIVNWHEPESDDDFVGIWVGHIVMQIPGNSEASMPESSLDVSFFLEYTKDTGNLKVNIRMDVDRLLTDWSNEPLIKQYGLTKDALWELFFAEIISGDEAENITMEKYYVSYNISVSGGVDALNYESSFGQVLFNDDKTKIKLIFYDGLSLGLGDEGFSEIILDKQ